MFGGCALRCFIFIFSLTLLVTFKIGRVEASWSKNLQFLLLGNGITKGETAWNIEEKHTLLFA